MVEIRKGITSKHAASEKLLKFFQNNDNLNGYFYIGYPIIYAAGESITVDALIISPDYGIIIFDIVEGLDFTERKTIQDDLYAKLSSLLIQHSNLNINRNLAVQIDVVTYAPACPQCKSLSGYLYDNDDLSAYILQLRLWKNNDLFETVISVIQSVIRLKTKQKRTNIKKIDSKGAKIKKIEDTIANLDRDQEKAVIESFEGIQRISVTNRIADPSVIGILTP